MLFIFFVNLKYFFESYIETNAAPVDAKIKLAKIATFVIIKVTTTKSNHQSASDG